MALNQEQGIEDMRKFINANAEKIDPEYAQGLLKELINQLEDSFDLNTSAIVDDILDYRAKDV